MTTQDIIKLLPLEEKEKIQLLNMYRTANPSHKYTIDEFAWKGYFALYNERLKINLDQELLQIQEGKGQADSSVYARAREKTQREMTLDAQESISNTDLAVARKAMEQIVNEIRAAKADKKARFVAKK